ncbi:hypothetical protein [Roseibacillus ishigakijimensis]|uniref:LamG-like jellyroll fold domain-containing protein n=1 Tax=Roseibacillus ishigakijimensis TaxID=454146 RepID=A0A934RUI0_9BACT|nr:hypothetical protein [Roseibacillus ishigakijimensis]MBK1834405.1 hypothetical protein [Roseibacillus ishigakijimensis]
MTAFCGSVSTVCADFTPIENFQSLTEGALEGQGNWVTNGTGFNIVSEPGRPYNKVLQHTGASDAGLPWPQSFAEGGTATYFFRVLVNNGSQDISLGITHVAPTTESVANFGNFLAQPVIVGGNLGARDGIPGTGNPNFQPQVNGLLPGDWYKIWVVFDSAADSYQFYVQSDDDSLVGTQQEFPPLDGTWDFRSIVTDAIVATQLTSNSGNTNYYIDDIYLDDAGANLADPSAADRADGDNDGMTDAWEMFYFGNLNQSAGTDFDNDGLRDVEEELEGTDPTEADTDEDGVSDGDEVSGDANNAFFNLGTDPLDSDSDDDGLTDGEEISGSKNPVGNRPTDPNYADTDADNVSDPEEFLYGSNAIDPDSVPQIHTLIAPGKRNGGFESRSGAVVGTNYKLGWDGPDPDNIDAWTTWSEQTTTSTDSGVEAGGQSEGAVHGFTQNGNGAKNMTPYLVQEGDVIRLTYDRVNGYTTGDTFLLSDLTEDSLGFVQLPGSPAQEDTADGSYTITYVVPAGSLAIGHPLGIGIRNNTAASWPGWDNMVLTINDRDSDNDGLSDFAEDFYWGNGDDLVTAEELEVTTGSADSDNDSYSNAEEVANGSDPLDANSGLNDSDGDGLNDDWERDIFGDLSQSAEGDFDNDQATNLEEESAGTDGADASSWPDLDNDGMSNAWEIANDLNRFTNDANGDADNDGFTNLEEHDAGSDPQDPNWTPENALLAHRWSFNGNLTDSAGDSDATIVEVGANDVSLNSTGITLTGGAQGESDYVVLGENLIGGKTTPVTIELWATAHTVQNWSRIFDFGSDTTDYLFMSWSTGTNGNTDRVGWVSPNDTGFNSDSTNAPYVLDVPYHIVLTITPAYYSGALQGSTVTWYSAPVHDSQPGGHGLLAAQGSVETNLHLTDLTDAMNLLGRSFFPDNTAHATYDEVRIWDGALSETERELFHLLGPDSIDRSNTDGDPFPDAWEQAYFGSTNVARGGSDSDGDGDNDDEELAAESNPNDATSTVADTDGDGLDDENFELVYWNNLLQNGTQDPDGDLVNNEEEETGDSNPLDANSSPDNDEDDLSDSWELVNFGDLDETGSTDPDNDGDNNALEFANGTDPNDPFSSQDSEPDGLADGWETFYFSDLDEGAAGDPDSDGATNLAEFNAGTNPTDGTSVPDVNNDGIPDGRTLIASDGLGTSSFDQDGVNNWDDTLDPTAGLNYLVYGYDLRTPATGDVTFAGARLIIASDENTTSNLVAKNAGVATIPYFGLDGLTINQAGGANLTLAGSEFRVSSPSELWANNGNLIINAPFTGSAQLNLTTTGPTNQVILNGQSTFTGDLNLTTHGTNPDNGKLVLGNAGRLTFAPTTNGVTNAITGAGTAALNGSIAFDLSNADETNGNQWLIFATTGEVTIGATFNVTGFTSDGGAPGSRIWTQGEYTFDEATGVLTFGAVSAGYADWASLNGLDAGNSGATTDAEGDGFDNLLEYQLGGDPLAADGGELVSTSVSDTHLVFTFERSDASESDTTLTFQWSGNLQTWQNAAVGAASATSAEGVIVTVTEDGGSSPDFDLIEVQVPKTLATDGKLFGRLSGSQQ